MANLPQEFRVKFDKLERKFAVSMVIFKKYQEMFVDIFKEPVKEAEYQHKSKKPRNFPCSVSKVFDFCWTLFITIKGEFPAVADDLVNSHHLLLACCDLIYINALLANRRDLLNPNFNGKLRNFYLKSIFEPNHLFFAFQVFLIITKALIMFLPVKGIVLSIYFVKDGMEYLLMQKGSNNIAGKISSVNSFVKRR